MSPSLQPATVFSDRSPSASSHGPPYAGPAALNDSLTEDAQRARRFALLDVRGPYSLESGSARRDTGGVEIRAVETSNDSVIAVADASSPIAMPWITTFLNDAVANSAAAPEASAPEASAPEASAPEASAPMDAGAHVAPDIALTTSEREAAAESTRDDWPLLEAGQRLSELAAEIRAFERAETSASHAVPTPSLPMWSDDELIDIMPVTHSKSTMPPVGEWATTARRDNEIANNPEVAAAALEALAARVRAGTVHLPQFAAELGDAAALATALAALLGIRR